MMKATKLKLFILLVAAALMALCGCKSGGVKSITISFETNGGNEIAAVDYKAGDVLSLPTPEKDGYEFVGWYLDEEFIKAVSKEGFDAAEDVTLYAMWREVALATTYTVTFDTMGGNTVSAATVAEGESVNLPTPSKDECVFEGWYLEEAFETPAVSPFTPAADVTLYAAWSVKKYEIRLYTDADNYVSRYYAKGETVDISEWETPVAEYEGDTIAFSCWMDEILDSELTENFVMGNKSMAFYAFYDMPQVFKWSYDPQTGAYTSTGAGVRPLKNNDGALYGTYTADITVMNAATTGVGIIWNLDEGSANDPYDVDVSYWYFHLNPANGGFQLSLIVDDSYNVMASCGINSAPSAWREKWTAYSLGLTETLEFTETVEFTPDYIKVYMDGDLVTTYSGPSLKRINGTHVGVRTNAAGNVMSSPVLTERERHTVTFDTNGGSALPDAKIYDNEVIGEHFTEKDGYTFSGWYLDDGFDQRVDTAEYKVTSDVTLYAAWKERVFVTLNFVTNGGNALAPVNYEVGTPVEAVPEREGYTFEGWYLDEHAANLFNALDCTATADFTIYAEWSETLNGFKHYLASDKYVSTKSSAIVYASGEEYAYGLWKADITLNGIARIGLLFNGNADNVTSYTGIKGYVMYFNATTAEAVTYTVQVNSCYNGLGKVRGDNGEAVTSSNRPSAGAAFNSKFPEGTESYNALNAFATGEASSVTLRFGIERTLDRISIYVNGVQFGSYTGEYRHIWDEYTGVGFYSDAPNTEFTNFAFTPLAKYTISFDTDGGTAIPSQTAYVGAKLEAVANPEKDGYTFGGWYADEGYTERLSLSSYVIASDAIIYAKWVDNALIHALSFNTDGGSEIADVTWVEGTPVTVAEPTKDGFAFGGWYYDEACSAPADLEDLTFTADGTLYAEWSYTVQNFRYYVHQDKYVANGASYATIFNEATYGATEATITLAYKSGTFRYGIYFASTQDPAGTNWGNSYDGYLMYQGMKGNFRLVSNAKVFLLWPDGITKTDLKTAGYATAFGDDYVAFAAGERDTYTFTMKVDYTPAYIKVYVNNTLIITYTAELSLFDGTGIALAAPDGNVTFANVTFTPTPKYTISFDTDGGSEIADREVVEGALLGAVTAPEKDGYSFVGWYLDEGLSVGVSPATYRVTEDATLYAAWADNVPSHTIAFVTNGGSAVAATSWAEGTELSVETPTRAGCTFAGWFYDDVCSAPADLTHLNFTADGTLYAEWTETVTGFTHYIVNDRFISTKSSAYIYASGDEYAFGLWEVDITLNAYARIGLFMNATGDNPTSYLNGMKGYAMYLAALANSTGNTVQLNSCYNALGKVPDEGGQPVTSSNRPNGGSKFSSKFAEDTETYINYAAFSSGEASSVKLRFGIEVTHEKIAIYVNGVLFASYTGEYRHIWDEYTGVGFFADAANVTFDNFSFTPLAAND
ncbi:MAG: InlB B-repeat-containing protein [Clostridia bacterium]|nr:InlB B-repeat-containing protein [Clostridia bacterium]